MCCLMVGVAELLCGGVGKLEYVGGGDALSGLDKVLAGQVWRCHTCRIDD